MFGIKTKKQKIIAISVILAIASSAFVVPYADAITYSTSFLSSLKKSDFRFTAQDELAYTSYNTTYNKNIVVTGNYTTMPVASSSLAGGISVIGSGMISKYECIGLPLYVDTNAPALVSFRASINYTSGSDIIRLGLVNTDFASTDDGFWWNSVSGGDWTNNGSDDITTTSSNTNIAVVDDIWHDYTIQVGKSSANNGYAIYSYDGSVTQKVLFTGNYEDNHVLRPMACLFNDGSGASTLLIDRIVVSAYRDF